MITIKLTKKGGLSKGLTSQNIGDRIYQAMNASMFDVHAAAVQKAPYKTGDLRRSLTFKVSRGLGLITGMVGSNKAYARIHNFGGWTGRGGRTYIKPKLYLTNAVKENKEKIQERFTKYLTIRNL